MLEQKQDSHLHLDRFAVKLACWALALAVLNALFLFLYGAGLGTPWIVTIFLAPLSLIGATVLMLCSVASALRFRCDGAGSRVLVRAVLLALLCTSGLVLTGQHWHDQKQLFGLGARWRVRRLSDEIRLQSWAEAQLALPPSQLPLEDRSQLERESNRLDFDAKQLPDFVRVLANQRSSVGLRQEYDGIRYIRLHLGGWVDGEWDLMLGGPDLREAAERQGWQCWREGVYLRLR